MSEHYQRGEILVSRIESRGLRLGGRYRVVDLHFYAFDIVGYDLNSLDGSGMITGVVNAHLWMEPMKEIEHVGREIAMES